MKYSFNTLKKEENAIFADTIKEFPEMGWYRELYTDFQEIINLEGLLSDDDKEIPSVKSLILATTCKLLHTSRAIILLSSHGYYRESLMLLRSVQEDYQHVLFFYFYPEKINDWINDKKPKSVRKLINKKIRNRTSHLRHYSKEVEGLIQGMGIAQGLLSKFAHTTRTSVLNLFVIQPEEPNRVSLTNRFERSAQRKHEESTAIPIMIPPIVGVPSFLP